MPAALLFLAALFISSESPGPANLNWISDAGGMVKRDVHGRVVAVDLRSSWAGDSDLASLSAISTLNRLDLSETRISDHGLRQLRSAPAIVELDLRYAELITDEGISALKSWKHLERLDLEGTKITDSALQHLSALKSLKALNIGGVLVTDAGLEALTSLTDLQDLTLGGDKLTDAGLQALRQLPSLTSLDLGSAQRTDSGLWSVSFAQPGFEAIATLKDLRRLRLAGTLIGARGLDTIKNLPRIELLDLHGCKQITDDALPILAAMRTLRLLDLTGAGITPAGLEKLRRARPDVQILHAASSDRPKAETAER